MKNPTPNYNISAERSRNGDPTKALDHFTIGFNNTALYAGLEGS